MRARVSAAAATAVAAALGVFALRRIVFAGAALTPAPQRHGSGSPSPGCVIMPAHNEAAILENTLEGLAETLRATDVSVVLVSDGSSDDTAGIAERWAQAMPNWKA